MGQPSDLELEWDAPPGCPTLSDLRGSIRQLLGTKPGPYANSHVSVRASAAEEGRERWLGTIETRSGPNSGQRTLRAESCKAVAGATALIVALIVDPDAVVAYQTGDARAPAPKPQAPSEVPAVGTVSGKPGAAPAREMLPASTPARHHWFIGPTAAFDWGNMPAPVVAVGAHVGLTTNSLFVDVEAFRWSQSRATVTPVRGGTFSFVTAALSACPILTEASLQYGVCLQVEYDRMKAEGFGADVNYSNAFSWLSIGAGALVRWQIGQRFSIPFRAGAIMPLAYPVFELNGIGAEVHRPSPVSARAELGIDLIF